MAEFTGERLVPGQVDVDLWNEHFSRYSFAARLARRKRVLDIGCGMGYGTAELAKLAQSATGIDVSEEAVAGAAQAYTAPNLSYLPASATDLPFDDKSFDLIVAFEVIEHLTEWRKLLEQARRLLSPAGQFIVSTPNKLYYAESRRLSGPNPYHVYEFEFEEFRTALKEFFPSVTIFVQNHLEGIVFQPCGTTLTGAADVSMVREDPRPEEAHFFVAVCALQPQTGAPTYVYVPGAANILREREQHIQKLEAELATKNEWLAAVQSERDEMLQIHTLDEKAVKEAQEWAARLDKELATARELLTARDKELAECVKLIDKAEATVVERTNWAQELDRELTRVRELLGAAQASRWVRLGRKIGLGPDLAG